MPNIHQQTIGEFEAMSKSTQESTKFESALVGKRVQVRSFDWQRTLTGTLAKVERYTYVLRLDAGGLLCVLKHSCGAIGAIKDEEPEA